MKPNFWEEWWSIRSRALNVYCGGFANDTFSARSHRDGLWTERWIDLFFYLHRGERNHCRNAHLQDLRQNDAG